MLRSLSPPFSSTVHLLLLLSLSTIQPGIYPCHRGAQRFTACMRIHFAKRAVFVHPHFRTSSRSSNPLRHLLSARSCTDTRAESMVPKHLLRNTIVLLILFKLPFFPPPAPAPSPAPSFVSRRYTIEMVDGSDILTKAVRLVEDLGLVCTQLFGPNSKPFKRGEGAGRGAASRGVPQRAPKVCSLAMVTYVCYANKPTSSHAACPLISPL